MDANGSNDADTTSSEPKVEDARLVGSDRVLAVLRELAEHPEGIGLDELSRRLSSSKPTVHRALVSLRKAGLAGQSGRGFYVLGDEFLRLAFRYQDQRPENARIEPLLRTLATRYGETTHYAILDGRDVVYRAKVDPAQGAMRLTSAIGGRNPAYRTAVGKLLLSYVISSEAELVRWLGPEPLVARTPHTFVTTRALFDELQASRHRGYGIDNQENELGVNCVALPVYLEPGRLPSGAVSISGLAFRCQLEELVSAIPAIRATIDSEF